MRAVLAAIPSGDAIPVVVMPRFVDTPKLAAFVGSPCPLRVLQPRSVGQYRLEANPNPHPVVFVNLAAGPAPTTCPCRPPTSWARPRTAPPDGRRGADVRRSPLLVVSGLSPEEWSALARWSSPRTDPQTVTQFRYAFLSHAIRSVHPGP